MWKTIFALLFLILLGAAASVLASSVYLPKADLIKGSGPEVYILENGVKYWIPDPETFEHFNFKWENIKTYSALQIAGYPQGSDWGKSDDHPEGSLLKGSGPEVYLIELGKRRWVPSPQIFEGSGFGWKYILQVDDDDLDDYDLGDNLTLTEPNRYPETTITNGPEQGETVESETVEFRYSGTNPLGDINDLDFETYLLGHDDNWDNQRSDYTQDYNVEDLTGGSYTFCVRAKNEQGYYDPTPASRSFQVGVSPYYQKVKIRKISVKQANFMDDYIILRNYQDETINLTGWTVQTKLASFDIPKAIRKYDGSSSGNVDIELNEGDDLVISAGPSPIGVDFLTNKCTGYLDQGRYNPSLDNMCPRPDSSEYSHLIDYCKDFIDDLDTCELPDYSNNTDVGGNSQCTAFLNEKLNYKYCYSQYKNDPDFLDDEWRVFLTRVSSDAFSNVRDTLILYDENGLKVDEYEYSY